MIFSVRLDCFLTAVAVSPTLGAAPQAISLRHIMPSETKVTIPWSIPAAVSVKGIVHVPAHNTPMKPGGRETLLIAIAEQDPAHERGATRPPSQSRSPEELSAHLRVRLAWLG
jgi:hypothetical protein